MSKREIRSKREASPDEAMDMLRGDHRRRGVVEANVGDQTIALRKTRFGHIEAEVFVEQLEERRWMPVTEEQARDIIVRAKRPNEGETLRLTPPKSSDTHTD